MHAALHEFLNGLHPTVEKWSVMSGPIVDQIKMSERAAAPHFERDVMLTEYPEWYSCSHCETGDLNLMELKGHITDE